MKSNLQNLFLLILIGVWLLPQTGCIPEDSLQNLVVTEDVIYVSGEKVRLTGRVIEIDGNVDDHGFYISDNSDFTSPIKVSLGLKESGLGQFVGSYDQLVFGSQYYYKAFLNIGGSEVVGIAKEFESMRPRIDSFEPNNGVAGTLITIRGVNFTDDMQVFIDDKEVPVISVESESIVKVNSPELLENAIVDLKVGIQDTLMTFKEKFTYHIGRWELETTFIDNTQLYESMSYKDGSEFIMGLGWTTSTYNTDIWSLDLDTYTWTNLNFTNGAATTRSPFFAGGYWGAGLVGRDLTPYFYHYSFGNFELKPFLTFRLYRSVGKKIGEDLYVFGGTLLDDSYNTTIYKYQGLGNTWSMVGDTPYNISSEYPSFTYNGEVYFLLQDASIVKYSPNLNSWETVGQFPSTIRVNGAAVTIGNKVYIGLFEGDNRMWEWDLITGAWLQKNNFTGSAQDINNGYFEYNNKAYFFRSAVNGGRFESDPQMKLWSLDPTKLK